MYRVMQVAVPLPLAVFIVGSILVNYQLWRSIHKLTRKFVAIRYGTVPARYRSQCC